MSATSAEVGQGQVHAVVDGLAVLVAAHGRQLGAAGHASRWPSQHKQHNAWQQLVAYELT